MALLSSVMVSILSLIHIYIVYLEMVLWTTPSGQKAFRMTADFASSTAVLAANQGLYNGFLAAGLLWGLVHPSAETALQLRLFFSACVAVAGAYGAATVGKKILYVQFVPAVVGLAVTILGV